MEGMLSVKKSKLKQSLTRYDDKKPYKDYLHKNFSKQASMFSSATNKSSAATGLAMALN